MRLGVLFSLSCVLLSAVAVSGSEPEPAAERGHRSLDIPRIDVTIDVDAHLDEPAWARALVFELDYETDPGENIAPDVRTECRMFYSSTHLHYGCHAFDPDPSQIRARYSDRDAAVADDTVGIAIDPFNSSARAYVLDTTALGVQNDRIYTELLRYSDPSWDAIWDSAGRITDDGYVVEAAIPFSSLRFPRREGKQIWSFTFRRYRPREVRYRIANHPNLRDNPCRVCQSDLLVGFEGIDPGRNLQITPTLTGIQTRTRDDDDRLAGEEPEFDPGITARWGMTPNLTLSGTINPDFSQVEADVAQLSINQQFALFFPERRPFFLEGSDQFNSPLSVVYSRSVADPSWGVKVTGREGKNSIGAFVARDEVTNMLLPGPESSDFASLDRNADVAVFRYQRTIGRESNLGLLYTDRGASGYSNQVAGIDGFLRFTESDTVDFQLLASQSDYGPEVAQTIGLPTGDLDDEALRVNYRHDVRNWTLRTSYTDIGDDFRADLGFLPQVGYRSFELSPRRRWYSDGSRWYSSFELGGDWRESERQNGELIRDERGVFGSFNGKLQSRLAMGVSETEQRFGGRDFDREQWWFEGNLQPIKDLGLGFWGWGGDQIDYEGVRPATGGDLGFKISYNFGRHLKGNLNHTLRRLDIDQGELFQADLSELRLVYQFNHRAFVRGIFQYTTIERKPDLYLTEVPAEDSDLFGQLLFTYKLNPQTAVYLGYSAAYVDRRGYGSAPDMSQGLRRIGDTAFLKLSYAWLP